MLYTLLRAIARLALRWYYRDIEVLGIERIPRGAPALLAANHNNALVDALLIGSVLPRRVRLTAKATLLEHPITRWIVRAVGIVPLRRTSDEQATRHVVADRTPNESRNDEAFALVVEALAAGELVLIFPEGKSHSEPSLAPLKTRCARIALQARVTRDIRALRIIPVGLTFEEKSVPRSRVLVQIGEAIHVDDFAGHGADAVQSLTQRIDQGLRHVTLNFESAQAAEALIDMSALLASVFDDVRPLHTPNTPLVEAVSVAQRLEQIRQRLPLASGEELLKVDAFLARLDAFDRRTRALAIPVNDLTMPTSPRAGMWFVLRELCILVFTLPIAAWGRVNHWLPLTLARRVASKTSKHDDDPAMHTLVSGLAFVLLFYAALAAIVGVTAGVLWSIAYIVSLPPSASLDFAISDRMRAAGRRASAYLKLRRDSQLHRELLDELANLRNEARHIDAVIG